MTRFSRAFRGLATALTALVAVTVAPATARAETEPKAPEDFVALATVDPTIIQEMRYVTRDRPCTGPRPACCARATP